MSKLKIDWATLKAAEFACKHWHYSGCLPVGKLVKVGAWEDDKYIGCVIFGRGANNNLCKAFNMKQTECIELCRIALKDHHSPVSQIMAHAIRFLRKQSPKLRLIVSYADPKQGHHGGVYQAANWIYTGQGAKTREFKIHGKVTHTKSIHSMGIKQDLESVRRHLDPNATLVVSEAKHRYIYPLDKATHDEFVHLAKPYPKRVKQATSEDHSESGGAAPTHTLQPQQV